MSETDLRFWADVYFACGSAFSLATVLVVAWITRRWSKAERAARHIDLLEWRVKQLEEQCKGQRSQVSV